MTDPDVVKAAMRRHRNRLVVVSVVGCLACLVIFAVSVLVSMWALLGLGAAAPLTMSAQARVTDRLRQEIL